MFALSLFGVASNRFLNLELSALEAEGKGKLVSSPRVITADQVKALIEQGTELPYQTATSSGATTISFRKANLKLEVTPQITPEGNIILDVDVNKDSVGQQTSAGYAINTKHVKTQVLVENGGTVVIGGIFELTETDSETKVPVLGDLPAVGNLFKTRSRLANKQEMLVFITPKTIVDRAPYKEALDFNNPSPKYDDAKTIYLDLINRLDAAIAKMDVSGAGISSKQDLIYQGDVSLWKKAANSLQMRLAMRMADVDPAKASSMAISAVQGGLISSNAENLSLDYIVTPPFTNPVYEDLVLSGRTDFVGSNTLIDKMNALADGRRIQYFDSNLGDGVYVGGVYGSANTYNQGSHMGAKLNSPDNPGIVLSYAEVEFLLAEAVERGIAVGGSAESHYNAGIKASFEEWGASGADAYLANPKVANATADGNWKQKIGIQKWFALFNNGLEGWTAWRLLDFQGFNVPEGLEYKDIPVRFIYSIGKATLNGASVKAAAAAIGGDSAETKLFFDKY